MIQQSVPNSNLVGGLAATWPEVCCERLGWLLSWVPPEMAAVGSWSLRSDGSILVLYQSVFGALKLLSSCDFGGCFRTAQSVPSSVPSSWDRWCLSPGGRVVSQAVVDERLTQELGAAVSVCVVLVSRASWQPVSIRTHRRRRTNPFPRLLSQYPSDPQRILRQSSSDSPSILRRSSSDSLSILRRFSVDPPAILRRSSSDPPTILRRSSSDLPTIFRRSSNDPQAIFTQTTRTLDANS